MRLMPTREKRDWQGSACRRSLSRALLAVTLGAATMIAESRSVSAFELFGIKLWGSDDKADTEIADPLRYAVTIDVKDDDADLKKRIEAVSGLKADEDHPVSGSLGLMTKARSDREQLVAALYEDARYEGVVDISIAGQSIDELPPDAEFKGQQPIPVTITVTPGQKFTLGDIRLKGDAAGLASADFGLISGGDAGSGAVLKAEAKIGRAHV